MSGLWLRISGLLIVLSCLSIGAVNGIGGLIPVRMAAVAGDYSAGYLLIDLNDCQRHAVRLNVFVSGLAWSPDGARIAVRSGVTPRDLFVVDWDGRNMIAVTNDSARELTPKWSNDGRTLFYSSDSLADGDNAFDFDMYAYDLTTATTRTLSEIYEAAYLEAYRARMPEGAAGGIPVRDTLRGVGEYEAQSSADGRRVAIVGDGRDGLFKVDVIDTETGEIVPLGLHRSGSEDATAHEHLAWRDDWLMYSITSGSDSSIRLEQMTTGDTRTLRLQAPARSITDLAWTGTGDIFAYWNANGTRTGYHGVVLSPYGAWTTHTPLSCLGDWLASMNPASLTVYLP